MITPADVKRHAVQFADYVDSYKIAYHNAEMLYKAGVRKILLPSKKTYEELYDDFVHHVEIEI